MEGIIIYIYTLYYAKATHLNKKKTMKQRKFKNELKKKKTK